MFSTGRQRLADTAAEFSAQLDNFCDVFAIDTGRLVERTIKKLFVKIVLKSPVDTGAYRASHGIATNVVPNDVSGPMGEPEEIEANREAATQKAMAEMANWSWKIGDGGTIWLYNNQPYSEVLEFGGYPNPPKKGSWSRKQKAWVIKSKGGFSKQAPQGIYVIAATEFMKCLQETLSEEL